MATPQRRLHRVTVRNNSRGLMGRGRPDRRSKSTIKLLNKHIAHKLSGQWSETWGLGGVLYVQSHDTFCRVRSVICCLYVGPALWYHNSSVISPVPEMTHYVSSGTLNCTYSLTYSQSTRHTVISSYCQSTCRKLKERAWSNRQCIMLLILCYHLALQQYPEIMWSNWNKPRNNPSTASFDRSI